MAEPGLHYSDDERERLRRALQQYGEAMTLSAQGLAIDITRKRTSLWISTQAAIVFRGFWKE